MKVNEVNSCSLANWYDKFKKHTIKSLILPMPPEVVAYMQDDGTLFLPSCGTQEQNSTSDKVNSDEEEDWSSYDTPDESLGATAKTQELEEFCKMITKGIKGLGGSIFPKLNWSSPKDASWVALNRSLRCSTSDDVFLLLKSSVFSTHDLTQPYIHCEDRDEGDNTVQYCLVLRQWMEINPAQEFRVFVMNKELVGISQRDTTQNYDCITADSEIIRSDIISFWREVIENQFPVENYVFDVWRPAKDKMILIDFNPFGLQTSSLLFKWSEFNVADKEDNSIIEQNDPEVDSLADDMEHWSVNQNNVDCNKISQESRILSSNGPEFRFIRTATGIQPYDLFQYSLPEDLVDISTGADPHKFMDFLQMRQQQQDTESSEDDLGDDVSGESS